MPEGRYGDGKTEIIKQKDEMMFFRSRGCEDRSSVAAFNCYIQILKKQTGWLFRLLDRVWRPSTARAAAVVHTE